MTEQLKEIGTRLEELRDICDISAEEMARQMNMSVEEYRAYEEGQLDYSFSFLYNAANILGVEVVDIMSGDSPKLSTCVVTKKGQGIEVSRNDSYDYSHLAFTFRGKKAEPMIVTVEPSKKTPVMHSHEGQEFEYILSGTMKFYIDEISYELSKGDSIYFDSSKLHSFKAIGDKPLKFLAIVIK
ncbi:MAG: cupin domain-containing protein [Ruminococcus sp.]|nr:cupin domain-containing protein [Ruminococcus sp.]